MKASIGFKVINYGDEFIETLESVAVDRGVGNVVEVIVASGIVLVTRIEKKAPSWDYESQQGTFSFEHHFVEDVFCVVVHFMVDSEDARSFQVVDEAWEECAVKYYAGKAILIAARSAEYELRVVVAEVFLGRDHGGWKHQLCEFVLHCGML